MGRWQGLRALIFDLDGTLYHSPELLAEYPRQAVAFVAERIRVPPEEARERYGQEALRLQETTGRSPSTTQVLVALTGARLDEWAAFLAARVDPGRFLNPADYGWLRSLLSELHEHYRLAIITNNNRALAERILRLLGIRHLFEVVLTTTESGRLKPDPTLYHQVARMLGVSPQACLAIGDRLAVDIIPARRAGLRAVLVRRPEDLRRLGAELLGAARQQQAEPGPG
ncbi:MAG: HAD family hydrolase [Anaerolineae bacterium]|nr:HAD family hydrolase [Anaerolineae bacterium]